MTTETAGKDKLADASSVLVATPDVRDAPISAISGLITNSNNTPDRVVSVAVCRSAIDWLDAWHRVVDGVPAALTCVDVESPTRSVAARSDDARPAATMRTVADASDLETLGETLTDVLTTADEDGETTAVCLHSLTDLLGRVDERSAFKFVVTLGELARNHDATVYVHVDSRASDAETIDVFAAACDATVEFDDTADVRVR